MANKKTARNGPPDSKPPARTARTAEEQTFVGALAEMRKRPAPPKLMRKRPAPPKFKCGKKSRELAPDTEDGELFMAGLARALGTADVTATSMLLGQLADVAWKTDTATAVNQGLAIIHNLAPRDSLEGLLVTQMMGTHNVAMEMLRRAMLEEQPTDVIDRAVNRATKLLRTFTAQIETLQRYRGKGTTEQRVVVEHVNVHKGGQAIVGAVSKGQGGPGGEN